MGPKGSATKDTWGSFVNAFDEAQMNIMKRARIGYLWPLLEMFKDRNQKHAEVIAEWLDPLVKKALEDNKMIDTRTSPLGDKTFLQHLADSTQGQLNLVFWFLFVFLILTFVRSGTYSRSIIEHVIGITRYGEF